MDWRSSPDSDLRLCFSYKGPDSRSSLQFWQVEALGRPISPICSTQLIISMHLLASNCNTPQLYTHILQLNKICCERHTQRTGSQGGGLQGEGVWRRQGLKRKRNPAHTMLKSQYVCFGPHCLNRCEHLNINRLPWKFKFPGSLGKAENPRLVFPPIRWSWVLLAPLQKPLLPGHPSPKSSSRPTWHLCIPGVLTLT